MDTNHKTIKTVILGGERTGKTALVKKYVDAVFSDDYEPAFEGTDQKQIPIDNEIYILDLIPAEPAGEQILCQTGEAFILLYAINNRRSFQHIKQQHHQILSARGPALSKIPVFLVGSKADLESERQVSLEEGRQLAIELHCQKLFEISAKTHEGEISDLFEKLVRERITMESGTPPRPDLNPLTSTEVGPPATATSQSPSTSSFRQSPEAITSIAESPRRSNVFDRLKFGSLRRKSSLQTLTRKKSGSFSNLMNRNQSRDQVSSVSGDNVPPRNNVRSVSAGNVLNGTKGRPSAPPSRQSAGDILTNTRPPAPPSRQSDGSVLSNTQSRPSAPPIKQSPQPVLPSPYRLDVDTSSWRETIKWPTEIIPEEDLQSNR